MNNVTDQINGIKSDISTNEELENEYVDDADLEFEKEDNNSSFNKNNDDLKKKMIKLMIIIGAVTVTLLLVLFIISMFINNSYSYEKVENVMENAAKKYFDRHKGKLPEDEKQIVEIEVQTLVDSEYMKDLSEYLKKEKSCSGKVQVRKSGSDYIYTPYLDCGKDYSTKFLVEEVKNEKNLVGSGYGLYNMNDGYVFRGEIVNNYVQMDEAMWRIVKINSDNTVLMVLDKVIGRGFSYDDRYNNDKGLNYGYNNYQTSRIKEELDKVYKSEDKAYEYYILSKNDKKNLVSFNLCIGKRNPNETNNTNAVECAQTTTEKIGLLTISDYANASIDVNCTSPTNDSCANYNYLANSDNYWFVTGSTEDTYSVYYYYKGEVSTASAKSLHGMRPVVKLSANTMLKEGKGTLDNPYILR